MSDNKPWNVKGVPWKTEAAFYGWVRGQLRRGWTRHPVKNLLIQNNRFKKDNGKGRLTWHLDCSKCKKATPQTKIQIDHIHPAGSLKTTEDIGKFVERLYFVTFDTIRPLCIPCHEVVTLAERKGMTFDEAKVEKEVINIMKKSVVNLKMWLSKHNLEYLTPKPSNIDQVRRIINERGVERYT
tara:strand:- start:335 stop:883 length:549 start_codon:yes stop_codon:yes gene_type:complete